MIVEGVQWFEMHNIDQKNGGIDGTSGKRSSLTRRKKDVRMPKCGRLISSTLHPIPGIIAIFSVKDRRIDPSPRLARHTV